MKIKQIPINELKPYDNNPRHNDAAVEYVAKSICDFGFKQPIVVDKNNIIVAGQAEKIRVIKRHIPPNIKALEEVRFLIKSKKW